MHQDLIKFGFLIADDKCNWLPCQSIIWLGYIWDTCNGKIKVTDNRIQKTELLLKGFIEKIRKGCVLFPVRSVARLIGQLISMQSAIGQLVRLRSRALYNCVTSRASWKAPVLITSRAFDEIVFWDKNLRILNSGKLESFDFTYDTGSTVFCDASGAGYAGFIVENVDSPIVGCWSEFESELSSTWRELEAVHRVLNSSISSLEGRQVLVNTDNRNVVSILKTGSRQPFLQDIAVNVYEMCHDHKIDLFPKWIPRTENKEADFLSRCTDSDDWSLENKIFDSLEQKWGPHTFDLFACSYNTKCQKFYSKYWCPGTSGIDAMKFYWSFAENYWLVPPPRLASQCVRKIQKEKCKCTMVLPMWKSAPYWPLLFTDDVKKNEHISEYVVFQPGKLTRRGRGRNGIFDGRPIPFCFIALRFV
ncbi:uncharacterized protein LOC132727948 [Ruditapes philippinarum]|uniref:uncharacterized protein LOC132727948 n=1 Tax=Ruditapes philippinarum TaxID=129788 RepID=UPI00295B4D06|nr:uncharacterized protein LOC132727948 [Ruditapes philippinarum]